MVWQNGNTGKLVCFRLETKISDSFERESQVIYRKEWPTKFRSHTLQICNFSKVTLVTKI